jgi:hypothetical protein
LTVDCAVTIDRRFFFVALLLVDIISVYISTTSFIAPLEDLAMSLKQKIKVRSAYRVPPPPAVRGCERDGRAGKSRVVHWFVCMFSR